MKSNILEDVIKEGLSNNNQYTHVEFAHYINSNVTKIKNDLKKIKEYKINRAYEIIWSNNNNDKLIYNLKQRENDSYGPKYYTHYFYLRENDKRKLTLWERIWGFKYYGKVYFISERLNKCGYGYGTIYDDIYIKLDIDKDPITIFKIKDLNFKKFISKEEGRVKYKYV